MHLELDAGEGVLQPFLDQADREMRDVDPDPVAPELLRRVNGGAAAAERVEHDVAFVAEAAMMRSSSARGFWVG